MKISYIFQMKDFLILFAIGIGLGIIYGFINILYLVKNRPILHIITDFIFTITFGIIFFIAINIINMGEFRLFLLIAYILGFYIERITLGKLFAKGYKNMYNKIINLWKVFIKTKIGKIIFKWKIQQKQLKL